MMQLQVTNLSFSRGKQPVLHEISLAVKAQQFVGILGPNGCGKSTLLKCLYNMHPVPRTHVTFLERDINDFTEKELARHLAVVSQWQSVNFDFNVYDMVQMGRSPHKKRGQSFNDEDHDHVLAAIKKVGLDGFQEVSYAHLSGGEKQRVVLARALAQEPQFLMLDEPTNHLDIKYQQEILQLVKNLGIPVLAVLHDLSLASHYCDYVYLMKEGQMLYHGVTKDILQPAVIQEVFDVRCELFVSQQTGKTNVAFI